MVENSPDMIVRFDSGLRHVYCNNAVARLLGAPAEFFIGKTPLELIEQGAPAEQARLVDKSLRTALETKRELEIEQSYATPSGIKHFQTLIVPEFDDNGNVESLLAITRDITERKHAEEENERLSLALNMAPGLIIIHDADGNVLYANQHAYDLHGYTREEFMKLNLRDLRVPEHVAMIEDQIFRITRDGEISFEVTHFCKDRSTLPLMINVQSTYWGSRRVFVNEGSDLSERKRMEEIVRAERDFAESIVKTAQTIILVLDAEGCIVQFNPYMEEISGYRLEEVRGKDWFSIFLPAGIQERTRELFKNAVGDNQTRGNVDTIVTKNGMEREIEWYDKTLKTPDGKVTGLLAIGRDVTESRRAEEAQRESEARYKSLIENLNEGVWVIDRESRTTFVNTKMAAMLGCTVDEMQGKLLFDFMDEQGIALANENLERRVQGIKEQHEFEFIRKDGSRMYALLETAPLQDAKGAFKGAIAGVLDITERKKAQQEKEEYEARIRQTEKLEAVGLLAGGMAHDFNNILGGILGMADLMQESMDPANPHRKYPLRIIESAQRGAKMIGQLLSFARKGQLSYENVDVHRVIEGVILVLKHTIDKRIVITRRLQAPDPIIGCDSGQLESAMLNLSINACDAMPSGGGLAFETEAVSLDTEACAGRSFSVTPGRYLKISVTDTGTGMDEETQKKIFEPFFTTKEQGRGTGLGLPSVYGYVKQLKGFIEVFSKPGQGSRFDVYFPQNERVQPKADIAREGSRISKKTPGGHILLVDDDQYLTELIPDMLIKDGYTFTVCTDGKMAVDSFREKHDTIDLVILDIMMPKMDGHDCFNELKKINAAVPVIISSGYDMEDNVRMLLLNGARGYIQKPYSHVQLSGVIAKVMNGETGVSL